MTRKPTRGNVGRHRSGAGRDWILWDGSCGFCAGWAKWVRRRDGNGRFVVVPYQEAPSPPLTPAIRERATRAVQVVTADGLEFQGGRAVLLVLAGLGYRWAGPLRRRPWVWAVEAGYRLVAANRGGLARILRPPR